MILQDKISSGKIKIGVIGLGYVGLPLAKEFAKANIYTVGFDVSAKKVDLINQGISYIPDVPTDDVRFLCKKGYLRATTNFAELNQMDIIFICVPTPFTQAKAPDLSFVVAAAESIKKGLRKDQLIILQSTTYPGTTEEIVLPILTSNGLQAGKDFYLAFSPERIDPGNKKFNAKNTPKVVGGIDKISTDLACTVFSFIIERDKIFAVSCPKVAELCKLLENTFRSVNIALVNELAMLCDRMNINIWEVIDAAATKPFGFMPFYPGPGVGGHCIPVDPYYLSWKAREYDFYTKFIELAAEVNQGMPYYTVNKLMQILNAKNKTLKGTKVLVLGAAFKKDIDDARNSASLEVIRHMMSQGADVVYNDPFIPKVNLKSEFKYGNFPDIELKSAKITDKLLSQVDCVIILVAHSCYDFKNILKKSGIIFDTVNATKNIPGKTGQKVFKL